MREINAATSTGWRCDKRAVSDAGIQIFRERPNPTLVTGLHNFRLCDRARRGTFFPSLSKAPVAHPYPVIIHSNCEEDA